MSERRILYFTTTGHQLYLWKAGRLTLEAKFAEDEEGVVEFRNFAKIHSKSLYYVLADLAGEDFHDELIPWLRGGDRQAVIERRLAQRYRDTRLAAAISHGAIAVAGERRNERLVLASFTNTQQFSPWLDALSDAGAKLAGVYSVPIVAPSLAAKLATKLGARNTRLFVVSMNSAGLRQSFLEEGKLRFARLERTGEMPAQAYAAFVRSETLRLVQYLSSLRVLPRDGPPITALVITPIGERETFEQSLPSDGRLTFRAVDLAQAAKLCGLRIDEGIGAEQVYLHQVAKQPPKEQFARSEDRKGFLIWQLQRGVVAAGALGLAACALFGGVKWFEISDIRSQTEIQQRETRNAAQEYQRVTATFPVTFTSTDNLKATVNQFRSIADRTAVPHPVLAHISRAIEQFPQIELDQIVWAVDRRGSVEKSSPNASLPIPAAAAAPATSGPGTALGQVQGDYVQTIEISGHVNSTQRSDYRAITAQVQSFADALNSDRTYEIVRTQLPFDTTSAGTLSGDIGTSEGGDTPRFTIVVAKRVAR
jgi:hypothetical protein